MYRILEEHGEVRERRNQRRHPNYTKPELLAEAPNQVWSWDITKLRGPVKWTYYYLYVILDIFSRYVVGWMLAHRESAALAQRLIAESCRKQDIEPDQLTLHADRGSSMRSKPVGLLLADLGVTKTHSRPYVSNDNPYSESQFKTMKYCPQFPSRFGSAEDGRLFCCGFFDYYNFHHRHSGIGLMTPADVHYGRAEQLTTARRQILLEAQQAHPERFVRGTPQPPVWCLRCLLLVMCTHPFAKEALTLHLARSEGHERYFGCNLMHRKVLASSHQHLMAEAPQRPRCGAPTP